MTVRLRTAAALLALPLGLAACSNGGGQAQQAGQSGSATSASSAPAQSNDPFSAQPGQEVDKDAFLQQSQAAMRAKKTYHLDMTMGVQGQTMKMNGDGDMSDPNATKVKMQMQIPGQGAGSVEVIMDGQYMYMKMPGQAGGKYVKVSLAQLNQQGGQNLQKLMNPAESLAMSQQAIQKITYVGPENVSGTQLKHYSVTVDPAKAGATSAASPSAGTQNVTYDIWVDGEKLMRKMSMNVQNTKVDMTTDKFGEPVSIAAPPAAQVTQPPTAGATGQAASPSSGSGG